MKLDVTGIGPRIVSRLSIRDVSRFTSSSMLPMMSRYSSRAVSLQSHLAHAPHHARASVARGRHPM